MLKKNTINNSISLPKQNRYLLIILWLIPLIILDVGLYFINYIDSHWKENLRKEQGAQKVESLATSSDFSYCFASIAGNFFYDFQSGIDSFHNYNQEKSLETYIKNKSEYSFRKPFPDYEFFSFRLSNQKNLSKILYTNLNNITAKRAWILAFEYLSKVNMGDLNYSDQDKKKGDNVLKGIFGSGCETSILAELQRGKTTYINYKNKSCLFIWDYIKNEKSGDIFGYFLITENDKANEIIGKLIALRELRNSQPKEKRLVAFIPLFPGFGGIVADEEFTKLPEYTTLTRKWIPRNFHELYSWHMNGTPVKLDESKIGNYQVFFNIQSSQSHCAVLLLPCSQETNVPIWIIGLNSIFLIYIFLLLFKGWFLGIWPQPSLKVRFFTTFLLVACIPLGLLIFSTYGYITNYIHTALYNNQSQLSLCINQFDSKKSRIQDEYRTAFLELKNNKEIKEYFKKLDEVNDNVPNFINSEAKKVLTKSLEFFNKNSRELPIISFTIIDERGGCLTNIGNDICTYYKDMEREFSDINRLYTSKEIKNKKLSESTLNALLYSVVQPLRNRILSKDPERKKWKTEYEASWIEKITIGAFKTALGNSSTSLFEEMDKRRGIAISRLVGDKSICSIHDYILVGGIPRFIIFLQWDAEELDYNSFKESLDYFAIDKPNFVFSSFKASPKGVKPWIDSRHNPDYKKSEELANQAYLSKSRVYSRSDNEFIMAVPSKKYNDTIIVGSFSLDYLDLPIFYRVIICIIIIIISLIIVFICVFISSKIFLKPIGNLKTCLDSVALGNLNIKIASESKDELGLMSYEFSQMTHELNERNKLSTLLSDHAVEALSKSENQTEISNVENFTGTALVSDIRNFTIMCEKNNPESVTNLLNEHFALMTKIISSNGGRIYKYIGDAIEVIFVDKDDSVKSSCQRAFDTSIEMLDCLRQINHKRLEKGLYEYRIGIGLSYGNMASGSVGSIDTRLDYAIIGKPLEKAAKLEGFSKLNPDFPLIVDKEFVNKFTQESSDASFLPLKNEGFIESLKINNKNIKDFIEQTSINSRGDNGLVKNRNNKEAVSENTLRTYRIEEIFPTWLKFSLGFIFIILFTLFLISGYYFTYNSNIGNKRILKERENQILLGQIQCEDSARISFDIKCREFAKTLNDIIEEFNENKILEENISNKFNSYFEKDEIIKDCELNKVFIKFENFAGIVNDKDTSFCDKIKIKAIANTGFSDNEIKQLSDSFRLCVALKELDKLAAKQNLENEEKNKFQLPCKRYMERTYGEPSRDLFGEKVLISLLQRDLLNSSVEMVFRKEPCFLYCIDYYKNIDKDPELVGYLVITMPTRKALNSIPLFLDTFTKNDNYIALKNTSSKISTSESWFFSNNFPVKLKNEIINKDSKKEISKLFLASSDLLDIGNINIGNDNFDVYLSGFYGQNNKKVIFIIIMIIILSFIFFYLLFKIIKGRSWINSSVSAKLWLILIVAAVIPVITLFFVFNLFINEYYYVIISQKRTDIQRFSEEFERKNEFSLPIVWNNIRKICKSQEIIKSVRDLNDINSSNEIKINALKNLRNITEKIVYQKETYNQEEKTVINTSVADVAVCGKNEWSYCFTDSKDKLDNKINISELNKNKNKKKEAIYSVSYIESESSKEAFGLFLKLIAKAIWIKQGKFVDKQETDNNAIKDELVTDTALKAIKTFFGEDTYIKIFYGSNTPIDLKLGLGRLGLMVSPVPDQEKPDAIFIWLITFRIYHYLAELSEKIKTDYKVFMSESFRYGVIAERTFNNNLRIPLGQYAFCVSSSDYPISTVINLANQSYILEATSSITRLNAVMILSYPERIIREELYIIVVVFWVLFVSSLIIIIYNMRNIANDIINPIEALITGIKEVNRENFSFRINTVRNDELGSLCLAFDKMIRGLDEKRTMTHMLSKTAQNFTLQGNGLDSTKVDSVLIYIGVPDFGSYVDRLNEYELFDSLKKQISIIAKLILEKGGEIDKIIGEKLLAIFPVNSNSDEAMLSACKVAKEICQNEKSNNLSFPVAIGLNYGNVISGFLGVGNKRDFTIIGDSVNVAARIESLSENLESNRCLISETVYAKIGKYINAKLYGEVELKGKSQPMKVYQLF